MPPPRNMKVEIVGADHQNKPDIGSTAVSPSAHPLSCASA